MGKKLNRGEGEQALEVIKHSKSAPGSERCWTFHWWDRERSHNVICWSGSVRTQHWSVLQVGSWSSLTWLRFLCPQEMEEVAGLPWKWGAGWVCWAVPAKLQLCLSVHEVLSSEWGDSGVFWGETQDFTAWALHLLPGFAQSRYQNPTNPRGGFLKTALSPCLCSCISPAQRVE